LRHTAAIGDFNQPDSFMKRRT